MARHHTPLAGAAPAGGAHHPQGLRAYCLYRRRLLGAIARVAARTVTTAIRTLTGERDLAVGIVACLQTHGSRANWHPPLHLLVTHGGFRPDGTVVSWRAHDTARVTALLEKRGVGARARGELTSVTMPVGLIGGTETVLLFAAYFIWPRWLVLLFWITTALVGVTVLQRLAWAVGHLSRD